MSVLRNNGSIVGSRIGVLGDLQEMFLEGLKEEMWQWFHFNRDRELFTVRKWFFSFTIRVGDLHGLFVLLFGEDPGDASIQSGE